MENLKWYPVLYNGLDTNLEITQCGLARRVKHDWVPIWGRSKFGLIDFSKLSLHTCGYNCFKIQIYGGKSKIIFIHQAVASVFYGYIFESRQNVVDHIDGVKSNNHKSNLRVVTQRQNIINYHIKNRDLPTGVHFFKRTNKYKSGITINKKSIHLGYFNNATDAHEAYLNKLKTLI